MVLGPVLDSAINPLADILLVHMEELTCPTAATPDVSNSQTPPVACYPSSQSQH